MENADARGRCVSETSSFHSSVCVRGMYTSMTACVPVLVVGARERIPPRRRPELAGVGTLRSPFGAATTAAVGAKRSADTRTERDRPRTGDPGADVGPLPGSVMCRDAVVGDSGAFAPSRACSCSCSSRLRRRSILRCLAGSLYTATITLHRGCMDSSSAVI